MTYGFVPAIQNERALAFVGIPLILCRYKSCNYSSLVFYLKRMFLFRSNVRHGLGMMLRNKTMRSTKVVTSFELENKPIRGGHKHVGLQLKFFSAVEVKSPRTVKCVPQ